MRQISQHQVSLLQLPDNLSVDQCGAKHLRRDDCIARLFQGRCEKMLQDMTKMVSIAEILSIWNRRGDRHGHEARLVSSFIRS